jgi:predicted Mrr-cat superfamily restriction endonuclease
MGNSGIPDGVWLVRGGINDELVDASQQKGAIALDWPDVGDLTLIPSLDDFKVRVLQKFAGSSPDYIRDELKHLLWFMRLIDVGDYVLMDDKRIDEVVIGTVTTGVEYNAVVFGTKYPYIRGVNWLRHIPRDLFTPEAQQDLYSILPIEDLRPHRREIHQRVTVGNEMDLDSEKFPPYPNVSPLQAFVRELAWESEDILESVFDILSRGHR